jgi:hypothetical protein
MTKKPTKAPPSKTSGKKETITPPKTKMLTKASKRLKAGDPEAGRIMSEEAIAVKQGVRKPRKP